MSGQKPDRPLQDACDLEDARGKDRQELASCKTATGLRNVGIWTGYASEIRPIIIVTAFGRHKV